MKRFLIISLGLMALLVGTVACSTAAVTPTTGVKDSNYTVKIGFPTGAKDTLAPDGPDLWALEKGFFGQEFRQDGISVEYIPFLGAAPAINEALAAGALDMAVIADIGALIGKASGLDTSLVSMGNPNGTSWWLLVSPSSNIKTVADLKGKKVATVKATAPYFYLLEALKAAGLKESDIQFINMTIPDSEQALKAGQIDAAVDGNWMGVKMLNDGFRSIDSTVQTPVGRGTTVIVARNAFISAHPSFFPRFYKVRQQAVDWANANRSAAFDLLVNNDGGIARQFLEPLYSTPFNFDQALSADVVLRIKEGESFLRDLGITRAPVNVDAWINQSVVYRKP
ncbi:ABC-type nitrate/sulfonate/bicarbonate transport system, periplasmic component [Dehalogenimonas alkenigignens]|uniref:ABC-type nitrate/sulfonate/bicarbonate transport system, periplasmic component n=1 Tax=Dehalogenimonas alkenigignens TaxID=1217799 RepID=A0A0W0GL91_9CHLR|nr:ABC transporter substrate-binding protein [Dehalogenimonas alkenigignens]KTB49302.1 ABC-type nitrate/sulfonate/bicarbonate transport system, periplasmic component [Dehalogenimonas alkenigignens]